MDIFKNNIAVGIGVALAATVLAPVLIPAMSSVGRPFAKSLLKGGMRLYEKSREAVALAGESLEDMVAEVRAEEAARRAPTPRSDAAASPMSDGAPAPTPDLAAAGGQQAQAVHSGNGAAAGAPQADTAPPGSDGGAGP